ncbi:MAG: hypothetical protein QME50_03430 [Candidatus Bathyarchaeota archaeon]|nr:hypothetical protein [Candidatus Bathyarchaeota archaeon]
MNCRGQFSLIAALLVAVILISTVIVTYSVIRNSPVQEQAQILSAIDETNFALKQILGFTIGYYGSVLQVTGNSSYARALATNYLHSGLVNIANMHPEWGTSFNVSSLDLTTYWFTNSSYSTGNLAVNYSLNGLGMYGITYTTSCRLAVQIENTTSSEYTQLVVTRDEGEPFINLGRQNFKFYRYHHTNSTWELVTPSTEPIAFANGTYLIETPQGIDPYSYLLQVEDPRGIIVVASSFSQYTITFTWNSTLYSQLQDATVMVELLQNGTLRWLGQNLQLTTQAKPIPPMPVKAIHVNQTINGVNQEVPFQIEDWTLNYQIPLGLTNNASVFHSKTMLVFLANPNVSKITIWWNGSDATTQTPYAYTNRYFTDNPSNGVLTNGRITLNIDASGNNFMVKSIVGKSQNTARFMRINNEWSIYGADPAYCIYNGIVRDIVHAEAEWSGGADDCPNVYAHIVITLPANATYYTYQFRLMFLNSQQKRNITDLCPISITTSSSGTFSARTENGTTSGYPIVSSASGLFYNFSSSFWQHHWSQLNSSTTKGFGIMFTDDANNMLYRFDSIANNNTGALKVSASSKTIELLPVARGPANFTYALDVVWHGAVVTFDGTTPIYSSDGSGLWILVEYPPIITVTTEN